MKYILIVDQGTTSTRVIIFDSTGKNCLQVMKEHEQIYPHAGWCEHNPVEIMNIVYELMENAKNKMNELDISVKDVAVVGITNQRETSVLWDKDSGEPLMNAVVWHDGRTKSIVEQVLKRHNDQKFYFNSKTVFFYFIRCSNNFRVFLCQRILAHLKCVI
jgi:glycerol kinase